MPEASTIKWAGQSGKNYTYRIFTIGTTFKKEGGNYIFAKETRPGYWAPIYAGEASNLDERVGSGINNHERLLCARREGATHVHAKLTPGGASVRLEEETDIRARWNPPCNQQ